MYYPEPSPFEQYRLKRLEGIAMSAEIYQMIAEAFEAGQVAEREACKQIAHDTYEGFGVNAKGIQYVKQRIIKQIEERGKE